jgi:hypothetical protein
MTSSFLSSPISSNSSAPAPDIYGTAFDSTVKIYEVLSKFGQTGENGNVTLPNGMEIDVSTITGMTTYSVYLQFLQAHKEVIDNIFVFVKNLENKLDNLLSS